MRSTKLNRFFIYLIAGLVVLSLGLLAYLFSLAKNPETKPKSIYTPENAILNPSTERVVIVSWDGAKSMVMDQLLEEEKFTMLNNWRRFGLSTMQAQTVVPSLTLPSHASIITGLPIAEHGITWNDYQPERGFVKAETIFEIARKNNYKTALLAAKDKFTHLNKPQTLDYFEIVEGGAADGVKKASEILQANNRILMLLHFKEPDAAGHEYGWGGGSKDEPVSEEYKNSLLEVDKATGELLDFLETLNNWNKTVVIITSDHGGHANTHGSADPEDTTIPWIALGGDLQKKYKFTQSLELSTLDTAPTVLSLLGLPIQQTMTGKVVLKAWE